MKGHGLNILLLLLSSAIVLAQPSGRQYSREEYIEKYKSEAIKEMHRTGIPASITLAQGILESGDGNSPLAQYANNHFGIKCHSAWTGDSFIMDDDEKNECFRKYTSAYESYKDHSEFLTGRQRYNFLFELKPTDYKAWAHGLKEAGYATNPKYANNLIYLIEQHNLYEFDQMKKVPKRVKMTSEFEEKEIIVTAVSRPVNLLNNIKYTVVKEGDSFYKIAKDFEMELWQLYRYNDMLKGSQPKPGSIVFLQPKRNHAAGYPMHIVKQDENLWLISQHYGIKLKTLYKINGLTESSKVTPGQKLLLRKSKS